ncbi:MULTISPECIES: LysM peptidoglycan-binding domain-containing M23 family metallopeptidase [unclassified Streptomyces]|uniref:LysM peptidoglycan-binding domain-containing M23 family metallopeptidase n=1 Tax=unclassified Streptomyces TaxID=2593676 RepID=UPI002E37B0A8|nr:MULTISPECIES: LysM peptidoglycan-binding domain-containing M23 family metallopeptidase [unclassified Streptomyces]WUC63782.1 LysM peptidoglycan-binding domain-containing M23 family metallopeptidase [Streptomyces sp. NBC_00539]
MPAKGKHRRPKSRAIPRGLAAAGTGGAALALPLMGAAGAHAVPAAAHTALPVQAPQLPVSVQAAPAAAPAAAPGVYTVVPGDYLSKIAAERHVSGGWQRLYADNREAVGADPSLIHPGLRLTLGGHGDRTPAKPASRVAGTAPAPDTSERSSAGAHASSEAGSGSGSAAEQPDAPSTQDSGSSTGAVTASGFVAPVSGGTSTPYKQAGSMWSSGYHTGVDFIASTGTSVKAVGAGTVVTAGWGGAYGNEVVIRHADGKYSQYGHLSQLSVSVGQSVTAGQQIGLSGATGNVTGPHLHFEIRTGPSYGSDIDPLAYLRSKGVSI